MPFQRRSRQLLKVPTSLIFVSIVVKFSMGLLLFWKFLIHILSYSFPGTTRA